MRLIHKETGTIDTLENWKLSYSNEELQQRSITADAAIREDIGEMLFPVPPEYCVGNEGNCFGCMFENNGRDCMNNQI